MSPSTEPCLTGVVVAERGDRLATGLCGALLAELGATVVRIERQERRFDGLTEAASRQALAAVRAGKVVVPPDAAASASAHESWQALAERAHVVLLSPASAADRAMVEQHAGERIVCSLTSHGMDAPAPTAGEPALQAQAGIMAVTGAADGAPEAVGVPILEMLAAINAATSIVAALRPFEGRGRPQLLDIAVLDAGIALMSTFVSSVQGGKAKGFRVGAGNHLSAPWNAYRTADGWIQLCTFSNAEWVRVLQVIGRPELAAEDRFKDVGARAAHAAEVDRMVEAWTLQRTSSAADAALAAAGLAVGPILTIPELMADPRALRRHMLHAVDGTVVAGSMFKLSRSRTVPRAMQAPCEDLDGLLRRLDALAAAGGAHGKRVETARPVADPAGAIPQSAARADASIAGRADASIAATAAADHPLAGIRVLEIGPYTAGPLTGRYLSDLGAEVIKIEPPRGEVTRDVAPRFGGWSGYFVNINIGKKHLALDLANKADKDTLIALARTADVLLTNLKPGALDKLGVGPKVLSQLVPGMVFCCISGFGADGAGRAALDTVVQGEAGIMGLVGAGDPPHRVGVSIADQAAAHTAPLAIIAALRHRDRTGCGQVIDLAMHDVALWLTQLAWPAGGAAVRPWLQLKASDGWCLVDAPAYDASEALASPSEQLTRAENVRRLSTRGMDCVAVLELDEVFTQPAVVSRGLVFEVGPPGGAIRVLRAPHRFSAATPYQGLLRVCADPDADRAALLGQALAQQEETTP